MEMKLFISSQPEDLEKEINHWLFENAIQVHHITQSQSERQGRFVLIVSIFYKISK
jgi:hypothetical protein